ncbi:MAG: hypothetical protein IJE68_00030 [Clostridia bacterium]|nr:hypothetical protein [Clostridia bacterium]
MNILFYAILFVIGIVIGSVWAIKANKMPKTLDMKKKHYSNHEHEEFISGLTYILLGGIISVILANILEINIDEFDLFKIIIYVFAFVYISTLVLVGGIDKLYNKIEKRIIGFGIISSIIYMIYLCAVDLASIHINIIYLSIYIVLLVIDSFLLRKYAKDSYIVNILMLLNIILSFTDLRTLTYTSVMSFIAIAIYAFMQKIQKKKNVSRKFKISEIPVGYFITTSNLIVLFMIRIFENYLI